MNLTLEERTEYYSILGTGTETYCGYAMGPPRKRLLADAVQRAFDAEMEIKPGMKPEISDVKGRVRKDAEFSQEYGFVFSIILVQLLASLIGSLVEWLIEKWLQKHNK